jgi:metallo-beta-lactamase family protein
MRPFVNLYLGAYDRGKPARQRKSAFTEGAIVLETAGLCVGGRYDIRAQVHTLGGYSAHADQADLLRFVSGMRGVPQEVRVVHGDDAAKRDLASRLRASGVTRVLVPGRHDA